jgi:hypothetical protein
MITSNSTRRLRADDLRVDDNERPGWISGADHMPAEGETVFCTAGLAEVVKVLGKTGDGSRLLELKIQDGKRPPFFVAASNVLVAPAH